MNLRILSIQYIIDFIERVLFYPKLKRFYLANNFSKFKTIIDVGSNKGQSIDFFLKLKNDIQIFGFEPNLTLYNKLKIKYKLNSQIILFNIGISSKNGKLLFNENIMNETSTFERLNYKSEYLKKKAKVLGVSVDKLVVNTYEVEVMTLATFLENNPSLFIDILKIDVEGHEYDCLLGLFNSLKANYPINFIQLESHNDDMYINNNTHINIERLLEKNGFDEVIRIKHSFGDFYEIIYKKKLLNET